MSYSHISDSGNLCGMLASSLAMDVSCVRHITAVVIVLMCSIHNCQGSVLPQSHLVMTIAIQQHADSLALQCDLDCDLGSLLTDSCRGPQVAGYLCRPQPRPGGTGRNEHASTQHPALNKWPCVLSYVFTLNSCRPAACVGCRC